MVSWIATAIFIISYGLIVSGKVDKTKVAFISAGLMLALKIVSQHEAFYDVKYATDYNVIFLLIGMMIIINIPGKAGIFQFLAIESANLANGKPLRILIFFACITATFSAFLDNVTTVLILVPVTLFIADELKLYPFPFLISEVMASTLVARPQSLVPPHYMIASKAQLTFMDFIYLTTPAILFIFSFFILTTRRIFRKKLHLKQDVRRKILSIDGYSLIKNYSLLIK